MKPNLCRGWRYLDRLTEFRRHTHDLPAASMVTFEPGGEHGVLIRDGTRGRPAVDLTANQAARVAVEMLAAWKLDHGL